MLNRDNDSPVIGNRSFDVDEDSVGNVFDLLSTMDGPFAVDPRWRSPNSDPSGRSVLGQETCAT